MALFVYFLLVEVFSTVAEYQSTCPENVANCSESNICTGCWQGSGCEYCQCTRTDSECIPSWTTDCNTVTCMTCSNSDYSIEPTWTDGTGLCKPNAPRTFIDHITTVQTMNFYLYPNDRIYSLDNSTYLIFQTDGDLVLYAKSQLIWHSNTAGLAVDGYVRFQWDRNLVISTKYGESIYAIGRAAANGQSHLVVTYRCVYIIEPGMDRLWYEGDGCHINSWPTFAPPTTSPTSQPTTEPSVQPTTNPSKHPTTAPTPAPTLSPTSQPTTEPSVQPTTNPSKHPTTAPTPVPTLSPFTAPNTIFDGTIINITLSINDGNIGVNQVIATVNNSVSTYFIAAGIVYELDKDIIYRNKGNASIIILIAYISSNELQTTPINCREIEREITDDLDEEYGDKVDIIKIDITDDTEDAKSKQNNHMTLIYISLSIILIIGIGFIYFISKKRKLKRISIENTIAENMKEDLGNDKNDGIIENALAEQNVVEVATLGKVELVGGEHGGGENDMDVVDDLTVEGPETPDHIGNNIVDKKHHTHEQQQTFVILGDDEFEILGDDETPGDSTMQKRKEGE